MENGDAGEWDEGGEKIHMTGRGGGGLKGEGRGDSANSRSRCWELMRPTENSNEVTVCYKHCPDSYVGVDIPVTNIKPIKTQDVLATHARTITLLE